MRRLFPILFVAVVPIAASTGTRGSIRFDEFHSPDGLRLVGSARITAKALRLTPAKGQRSGGAWFENKQPVGAGFDTEFTFRLTQAGGLGHGADGFAFVIQNKSAAELAGRGNSGGFAPGDGGGNLSSQGIPESVAVFFDTFQNEDDPSNNFIAICTNGKLGQMNWPPPRLGIVSPLGVRMKDKRVHRARIRYQQSLLSVYVDDLQQPVLRAPADLTAVTGRDGHAWVGFTASTGGGYENHDILSWSFTGEQIESSLFDVSSRISYHLADCMEGRNLCTPEKPTVEERGAGEFYVLLPAHMTVSIPNPQHRAVRTLEAKGTVCFGSDGESRCADAASVIQQWTDGDRTWFSASKARADRTGQGFVEFRAIIDQHRPELQPVGTHPHGH